MVHEAHTREIEEYRQRKYLYREFESEETIGRNMVDFERRKAWEQQMFMPHDNANGPMTSFNLEQNDTSKDMLYSKNRVTTLQQYLS